MATDRGDSLTSLEAAINASLSDPRRRQFVTSRWLDQTRWMDRRAVVTRRNYFALRLTTIVGGVVAPSLFTLHHDAAHLAGGIVSLIVAASAAVEEFFHYGERWRHYRATAESLKAEGWKFLEVADWYVAAYKSANGQRLPDTPEDIYQWFVGRVERIIGLEIQTFLSKIAEDHQDGGDHGQAKKS